MTADSTSAGKLQKTAAAKTAERIRLVVLDPGHFHAALLQKKMYPNVDTDVHVYAQAGPDLDDYLNKVMAFNQRADNPTAWAMQTHTGPDFLEQCIAAQAGNVMVISGNNLRKTDYLSQGIQAGFNVLADKPMAVDADGFRQLEEAFASARQNGVMLYDIMTERFEITTLLQRELSMLPEVFGQLERGTLSNPAITKESVHYFSKVVAGSPLKRPGWFFDVQQQGEGIVDITTHLVDLVQWESFPDQVLDYRTDVEILDARRWPTAISKAEFEKVTGLTSWPAYLHKDVGSDNILRTYANGEINYTLKGVHAKVVVRWDFEAPAGAGDSHYSIMRGSRANLVIRQGLEQQYRPTLYIEPCHGVTTAEFEADLARAMQALQARYPGVSTQRSSQGWEVLVPASYHVGHEAHFSQVTEQFLAHLQQGALPEWEVPNMLAKYFTTTQALVKAKKAS